MTITKTKYKVICIIKPDIDKGSEKALINRFNKAVADNDAEELESKDRSKRRFAYEIEKYREGTYHIMTLVTKSSKPIDEFSHLSHIDNRVLRSMTVKLNK